MFLLLLPLDYEQAISRSNSDLGNIAEEEDSFQREIAQLRMRQAEYHLRCGVCDLRAQCSEESVGKRL